MLRTVFYCLCLVLACSALAVPESTAQTDAKPLRILSSTFPLHQTVRNIVKDVDSVEAEILLPASLGCPHDYTLTPLDMQKIAKADVLVINGLGLEEFAGSSVRRANADIEIIDSSSGITGVIENRHSDHSGHSGANPHLFASPRLAAVMVRTIASRLAELRPQAASAFEANAKAYAAALSSLADEFSQTGKRLQNRRVIVQHDIFDYFARDLGLEVTGVIQAHPGQELSAAEMLALIDSAKHTKAYAVFTEPQYPADAGQTIAKEAGIPVSTLDPVSTGPEDAPLDYYETVMRKNLKVLKSALGAE